MKAVSLIVEEIGSKEFKKQLQKIYLDEDVIEYQIERYREAICRYQELWDITELEIYSAPGRSEIGGNHTDHQHGNVLAAAVNVDAIAIVGKSDEKYVEIISKGYGQVKISLGDLAPRKGEEGLPVALIRGVIQGFKNKGYQVGGMKAYVTSDVLNGSGLSSSAAFEVLIGIILSGVFNSMSIEPIEIAKIAQYAEVEYFGKPCGLMDQTASAVGALIHIDFQNVMVPKVERLDKDFATYGYSLCIVDTRGSHSDLTDNYAAIPEEMGIVAQYMGKEYLQEVDEQRFIECIPKIRALYGDRVVLRAIHFFAENARVLDEVTALKENDFARFLWLIQQSGNSSFKYLQNIYAENDITAQDISIGLAISEILLNERGAFRVHGGGFAGTIQAIVPDDCVAEYRETMEKVFDKGACEVLKIRAYGGIKVI